MNGRFFVFDGMDGAGKSTALKHLQARLEEAGYRVTCSREPGGSALAEDIRACMLKDWPEGMPLQTELLLVFAARAAHMQQTILPALERDELVLCDRFIDSSFVYQGILGGADAQWISELGKQTISRRPDKSFIFDLPVDEAMRRMQGRGKANRFDRESEQRLQQVRDAFRQRVESQPGSHQLIDASRNETALAQSLFDAVSACL